MVAVERTTFDRDSVKPTQQEGLEVVLKPRGHGASKGRDALEKMLKDPWNQVLIYRMPGEHNKDGYDLYSIGADGVEGTADDATNW